MRIKQQKDIEAFPTSQFEGEVARELFDRQSELLEQLVAGTAGKSQNQTKTLGYGGDCCDFHFFRTGGN